MGALGGGSIGGWEHWGLGLGRGAWPGMGRGALGGRAGEGSMGVGRGWVGGREGVGLGGKEGVGGREGWGGCGVIKGETDVTIRAIRLPVLDFAQHVQITIS